MSNMTETVLNEWIQKVVRVVFILSTVVILIFSVALLFKFNNGIFGVLFFGSMLYPILFIFPIGFIISFKLRNTRPRKLVRLKKQMFFDFFKSIGKVVTVLFSTVFLVSLITNFIKIPSDVLGNSLSAIFNAVAFTLPFFAYKYIERFPERIRLTTGNNFSPHKNFSINPATRSPLLTNGTLDINEHPFSNENNAYSMSQHNETISHSSTSSLHDRLVSEPVEINQPSTEYNIHENEPWIVNPATGDTLIPHTLIDTGGSAFGTNIHEHSQWNNDSWSNHNSSSSDNHWRD